MRSAVLSSERAIQVNIEILRAFVRLFLNPENGWNGAPALSAAKRSRRKAAGGLNDENGVNPPAKKSFLFPPSFIY